MECRYIAALDFFTVHSHSPVQVQIHTRPSTAQADAVLYHYSTAKLDSVKTYMRMRRVPEHLKVKVIKWFDYLWSIQKTADEEKSVGFLPGECDHSRSFFVCFLFSSLRFYRLSPYEYFATFSLSLTLSHSLSVQF